MGTSVPRRNEKASPPGEVKVYKLTPEELAAMGEAKPIPRSQTKKPIDLKLSPAAVKKNTEKNAKKLEEQKPMKNIIWYTPERKVEGPSVTLYANEGFGFNQSAVKLTGFKQDDHIQVGLDAKNKTLYVRVDPSGIKMNKNRNDGLRSSSKGIGKWAAEHKIKRQKYALEKTEEPHVFKAAVELEK